MMGKYDRYEEVTFDEYIKKYYETYVEKELKRKWIVTLKIFVIKLIAP